MSHHLCASDFCLDLTGRVSPMMLRPRNQSLSLFTTLKHKGLLIMHRSRKISHISVRMLSSCERIEANPKVEERGKDKLLIDCENSPECVIGGVVALGKFDALHLGHRALAIQASKAGVPFLLSFVGIAEVLGWEQRPPIVAKCDRKRVLSTWAPYCSSMIPREFSVQFSSVRHLSPQQFVERLSNELGISGVVAGENYRFGYKASGDASELVRLCNEYGMNAYIVSSVMDKSQLFLNDNSTSHNTRERGQVSSTRVRHALDSGDMRYVAELLGRDHRLIFMINEECDITFKNQTSKISVPKSCILNHSPKDGMYKNCNLVANDLFIGPCITIIDATHMHVEVELDSSISDHILLKNLSLVGVEFGYSLQT